MLLREKRVQATFEHRACPLFATGHLARCLLCLSIVPSLASAQPASGLQVERIASGLDNPVGLAVIGLPKGPQLLVLERAGRLLAIELNRPSETPTEVAQAPLDDRSVGAHALLALDERRLLVAFGGDSRKSRGVMLLDLTAGASDRAEATQIAREIVPQGDPDKPGRYAGLARNDKRFFVAFAGDEGSGELLSGAHSLAGISDVRPLPTARALPPGFEPRALALSPEGYVVAVGELQDRSEARPAAQLVFADPAPSVGAGDPVVMDLDLPGVVAIAYSPITRPTSKRLYAMADEPGGLYRIDAAINDQGRAGATGVKLLESNQPTAMAFGEDGALYIATAPDESAGEVLRITGEL